MRVESYLTLFSLARLFTKAERAFHQTGRNSIDTIKPANISSCRWNAMRLWLNKRRAENPAVLKNPWDKRLNRDY